jgi:thiol-disulfide isomerase/thioredoxin
MKLGSDVLKGGPMKRFRWAPPLALAAALLGAACGTTSDPYPAPVPTVEVVSLPGLDTSALTPRERREWSSQMTELMSPCNEVPVSIATCLKESRPCKACKPAAELLLKLVQNGIAKKDRDELYRARFDPKAIKTYVTDGSPEKGSPDAPITIVEWADFECPACQMMAPVLDDLLARYPNQIRLVYKNYPLKDKHPHAEVAARAAIAAGAQGKFWEMHHRMFAAHGKLEQTDLEAYAKEIGLDLAKFRADMSSPVTLERLEKDVKQAEGLGLSGTPYILINGREANDIFFNDPEGWIKLDMELLGRTPQPVGTKPVGTKPEPGAPTSSVAPPTSSVATSASPTGAPPTPSVATTPSPGTAPPAPKR